MEHNKELFTEGKWMVEKLSSNFYVSNESECIAEIYCNKRKVAYGSTPIEAEANAHLIAASKDLYYALQKIESMFPILAIAPALKIEIAAALSKANPESIK